MPSIQQLEAIIRQSDRILRRSEASTIAAMKRSLRLSLRDLEARMRRLDRQSLDPRRISDVSKRESRARLLVAQLETAIQSFDLGTKDGGIPAELRQSIIESERTGIDMGMSLVQSFDKSMDIRAAVDLEAVNAAVGNASARLTKNWELFAADAEDTIVNNLVQGRGPGKLAVQIRELTGGLQFQAERIARTETAFAHDRGTRNVYGANDVELIQVNCVLDEDVCGWCSQRHMLVYKIDDNPVPVHPNCRCRCLAFRKEWLDEGLITVEEIEASRAEALARAREKPRFGLSPAEKYAGRTKPSVPVLSFGAGKAPKAAPRSKPSPAPKAKPAPAPRVPAPGSFKSLTEARDWFNTNHGHIKFETAGAHIDTINPTLERFDKLAREFPEVAAKLNYFGTNPASKFGKEIAHATTDGKEIGINPDYFGDAKKLKDMLAEMERRGFSTKGSSAIDYVLTHEFGHQVDHLLKGKYPLDTAPWKASNLATHALSDYAMTNRAEAWAEGFASFYFTAPGDQTDYVKEQRKLIEELLKRLRTP